MGDGAGMSGAEQAGVLGNLAVAHRPRANATRAAFADGTGPLASDVP